MAYGGNLHIVKALSNVSVEYKNAAYISDNVFPTVQVNKESDVYHTHVRDFRLPETYRANKSPANMATWAVSTSSYSLEEHALSDVITERDRDNSDTINMDVQTTEFLTDKILMRKEKMVADLCFTTTTWGNYAQLNTASSWNYNTTTSAPIQNILSATTKILYSSGQIANVAVFGNETLNVLKENPNVYGRIQYVERAIITPDILASLFDLEKVLIGKAVIDIGMEGVGESITTLWGGHALIAYVAPRPALKIPSAGYMLEMKPRKTKKWREEKLNGDIIEVSTMMKPVAVATSSAYYFTSVTGLLA